MALPTRKNKKEKLETEDDSTGGNALSTPVPGGLKSPMPPSVGERQVPSAVGESRVSPKIVSQRIQMVRGEHAGQRGIIVSTTSEDRNNPLRVRLDEDDFGCNPGEINCTESDLKVIDAGSERRRDSLEMAASVARRYGYEPSDMVLQLTARDIHEWADTNNINDIRSQVKVIAGLFHDVLLDNMNTTSTDDTINMIAEDCGP